MVEIEGQPAARKDSERISLPMRAVTPGYFALLGLPIFDGRDFRSTDDRKAPASPIVNQALADRYFPTANAIGKKIWLAAGSEPPIGNRRRRRQQPHRRSHQAAGAGRSISRSGRHSAFSKHLVVRTAADPRSVMSAVQRELRAVDPTVAVENMKTLEQIRGDSLASRTFAMQLLVGFAVVGSVLTLVGIYGVLSLSVARAGARSRSAPPSAPAARHPQSGLRRGSG